MAPFRSWIHRALHIPMSEENLNGELFFFRQIDINRPIDINRSSFRAMKKTNSATNIEKGLRDFGHILDIKHEQKNVHIEKKGIIPNVFESVEINKININSNLTILNQQDISNSPIKFKF